MCSESTKGEYKYSSTLSLTSSLEGSGWLTPCFGRFTPVNDPVPILYEAESAPGPVWTGTENHTPVFDSFAVQPVANRYSDYTLPAHSPKNVQLFNSRVSIAAVMILRVAVVYV